MDRVDTVAIIGVGLIGGSIGLALRRRKLARNVIGIGRRESSLSIARDRGAVTSATTVLNQGVADAELVVVATPVDQIVDHVRQAAAHCRPGALITDVGSTKTSIVEMLDGELERDVEFVGSHPLAGGEKAGPDFSRDDLFDGCVVIVTPTERTPPSAVERTVGFWTSLGASVCQMSPSAHDGAVAATSHLPHIVASTLAAATPQECLALVASGWRDTTRVAAGSPRLWEQILRQNRPRVLQSLDEFAKVLDSFRDALQRDDAERIAKILETGKRNRDAVGS